MQSSLFFFLQDEKKKKHSPVLLYDRIFWPILLQKNPFYNVLHKAAINSSFKNMLVKFQVQHGEIFTLIVFFFATIWRIILLAQNCATSSEFVKNDKWRGREMAGEPLWLSWTLLHGQIGTHDACICRYSSLWTEFPVTYTLNHTSSHTHTEIASETNSLSF